MHALPPGPIPGELTVTGLPCPDCAGSLGVRAEGRHCALLFECRVGHTYDVADLLAAKEDVLERRLWAAAAALTELTALMSNLAQRAGAAAEAAAYRDRASRARAHAAQVTAIVHANRPIDLRAVVPVARPPADDPPAAPGPASGVGEPGP